MNEKKSNIMPTEKQVYFIGILPTDDGNIKESDKKIFGTHGDGKIEAKGDNAAFYYRRHSGDENGQTYYKWGTVVVIDYYTHCIVSDCKGVKSPKFCLSLIEEKNQNVIHESSSDWIADSEYVMTGRIHVGDENQPSNIISKRIYVTLKENVDSCIELEKCNPKTVISKKESDGTDVMYEIGEFYDVDGKPVTIYLPITGRNHSGDENGKTITTFTQFGFVLDDNGVQLKGIDLQEIIK